MENMQKKLKQTAYLSHIMGYRCNVYSKNLHIFPFAAMYCSLNTFYANIAQFFGEHHRNKTVDKQKKH